MRILLVGEYSRLHNSLKEGLISLNHEVIIVSSSDGFKDYAVDYSIDAKWSNSFIGNIFRQGIFKVFQYDIAKLESGLRFYFLLPKFKNFDIIQLINEAPIKTNPGFELFLLKKLKEQNEKLFLLSAGVDYMNVSFYLENRKEKSMLLPYFENENLKQEYRFAFEYLTPNHKKIHDYIYNVSEGVIASDFDYVLPLKGNSKFLGLVPNPINTTALNYTEAVIEDKIIIFLGINQWTYHQKGIRYFESALAIIQEKYSEKVEVIVTKNIPYKNYINLYNKAHILLDQVYANDQGYNALEAMAKGKVVFSGAEKEFTAYYQLKDRVVINAIPDVDYLVNELSFLIENPEEIKAISKRARAFVEKEHDYIKVAEKYITIWKNN